MTRIPICKTCSGPHYKTFCYKNRKPLKPSKSGELKRYKRPARQSDKEKEYQLWLKEVARPAVIERDGELCRCPNICHNVSMLDLDHVLGKGSHPQLKRSIENLQLLCRFCHINKTINKPCPH